MGSVEDVGSRVCEIAARVLKIDGEIASDVEFEAFATWDSMAALVLLTELEAEFACPLDPATLFECRTVDEVAALIHSQLRP